MLSVTKLYWNVRYIILLAQYTYWFKWSVNINCLTLKYLHRYLFGILVKTSSPSVIFLQCNNLSITERYQRYINSVAAVYIWYRKVPECKKGQSTIKWNRFVFNEKLNGSYSRTFMCIVYAWQVFHLWSILTVDRLQTSLIISDLSLAEMGVYWNNVTYLFFKHPSVSLLPETSSNYATWLFKEVSGVFLFHL